MTTDAGTASVLDLVLGDRDGFVATAFGRTPYRDERGRYRHKEWQELRFRWPAERARLVREVEQELASGEPVDIYFCPAVRFTDARNGLGGQRGTNAAPPRTLWADADQPVDVGKLAKLDALLVDSGQEGHRHIYVPLHEPVPVAVHRKLNRALAVYLGADSKWADDSLLRLPDTKNFKPTLPLPGQQPGLARDVKVVKAQARAWQPEAIAVLLGVDLSVNDTTASSSAFTGTAEAVPDPLPANVVSALAHPETSDRSKAHARVVGACLNAGLSLGQAVTVCSKYPPSLQKYDNRIADEVARFWDKATADRAHATNTTAESDMADDDAPIRVVSFPVLAPKALYGLPGKIVAAVAPHTEAHPAPILLQFLARFGCSVGRNPYIRVANTRHHARLWPLIIGNTSDGAKGTSEEIVTALFRGDDQRPNGALEVARTSGLSSGEGLITPVQDAVGEEGSKGYEPGVVDKRLLVVETEFGGTLKVMDRQGNSLDRVFRQAWDGDRLSTMTKAPQVATDPHIVMIAHASPDELRARMTDTQLAGGTMNRTIPCASRRVRLLSSGGNLPTEIITEFNVLIAEAVTAASWVGEVVMSEDAKALWDGEYATLRRSRPEGPVAKMLARSAPQVLRVALTYALADKASTIEYDHLAAALAMWQYAEQTALWMFGSLVDPAEMDGLEKFIAAGGASGRTRTAITVDHFKKHRKSEAIKVMLADLLKNGRVRQETVPGAGRTATRYIAC